MVKNKASRILVYGSLYMDERESYEFAETQIHECIAKAKVLPQKIALVFDIVATPVQIASGLARQWGQHILDYCDQQYPELSSRVVGVTDNDLRRVMRDILITRKLAEDVIDDIHLIEME